MDRCSWNKNCCKKNAREGTKPQTGENFSYNIIRWQQKIILGSKTGKSKKGLCVSLSCAIAFVVSAKITAALGGGWLDCCLFFFSFFLWTSWIVACWHLLPRQDKHWAARVGHTFAIHSVSYDTTRRVLSGLIMYSVNWFT